jgi:hypothetical protein
VARLISFAVVSAAIVVIVVGAVARIGPASGPDRRTVDRSFASLVAPIATRSNATGADLRRLLSDGPSFDRATFFSDLASIAADTAEDARTFAAVTPPLPAEQVAASCGAAIDDRARVGAQVRVALGKLLGGPEGRGGGDAAGAARVLVAAGTTLESADGSWATCRRTLRGAPGSARLPASTWVADRGAWQDAAAGAFVASLVGSASLLPVHGIAIVTITTSPAAVPGGAGVSVLPATSTLQVEVVVADRGNVDERGVTVVVTAVPQGTAPPPAPVRVTTDLSAGASVALMPAPIRVRAGTSYVLDVVATPSSTGAAVSSSVPLRVSVTPTTTTTTTTTVAPTTTTTPATTTTKVRSG